MFLKSSRYYKTDTVDVTGNDGETRKAVKLRRLPATTGSPRSVVGNDRLDIIAQQQYAVSTRFWHIADANTELEANDLVKEVGRIIDVPEN